MPTVTAPAPGPKKPRPAPIPAPTGPLTPKEELKANPSGSKFGWLASRLLALQTAKACTVFFSYHPRSQKKVRLLRRLLENQGLPCWMHPGSSLPSHPSGEVGKTVQGT